MAVVERFNCNRVETFQNNLHCVISKINNISLTSLEDFISGMNNIVIEQPPISVTRKKDYEYPETP